MRKVMIHFPSRASEWATSIILLNWAILIYLSEGEALGRAFGSMTTLAEPITWAIMFSALAVIRICLLIINGKLYRSAHYRAIGSFLSCFAWFQITIAYLGAETITMALAVYPVLLALDFYNAFRTAIEARITDEGLKDGRHSDKQSG